MSTKTIRNIADFLEAFDKDVVPMMFRGQSKDWALIPSLGRLRKKIRDGYEDWKTLQRDMVERFAKYARPLLDSIPDNYEEWLAHAQHHGVPTRLLDWTTNPLKALFWAVEDRRYERVGGVVWAFDPAFWQDDGLTPRSIPDDELIPFLPPQVNSRVIAQDACFVAFPAPENKKLLSPMNKIGAYPKSIHSLEKIIIPATVKRIIRIELRALGITHRSLFPDLDGLAREINSELNEI